MKRNEKDLKTKYSKLRDPCISCQIFFDGKSFDPESTRSEEDYPPFGNCAEYDVIRTKKLSRYLGSADVKSEWSNVEKACTNQFLAFKEFSQNPGRELDGPEKTSENGMLQAYHKTTRTPKMKVLRYEWDPSQAENKLIAVVWPPEKLNDGNNQS